MPGIEMEQPTEAEVARQPKGVETAEQPALAFHELMQADLTESTRSLPPPGSFEQWLTKLLPPENLIGEDVIFRVPSSLSRIARESGRESG